MTPAFDPRLARGLAVLTATTRKLVALANEIDRARTAEEWARVAWLADGARLEAGYVGWLAKKLTGGAGQRPKREGTQLVAMTCNGVTRTDEIQDVLG
jgi:hypothetical protein